MTCSHWTLPVGRSTHSSFHWWSVRGVSFLSPPKYKPFFAGSTSPELMAVVRNTRSPQTIGEDQPRPGISTFHATFSVADQWSGKFVLVATPRAPGPRNCGQETTGAFECR